MVEKQITGKRTASVDGCVSSNASRKPAEAHRLPHRPASPAAKECSARTLARRLLPGLEQARAIVDVAILTLRYYADMPPDPNAGSAAATRERARHLIAAFDDGRLRMSREIQTG